MTDNDGREHVYEDRWKNDVEEGKGKFSYMNGDTYQRDVANGLKEGEEIYT